MKSTLMSVLVLASSSFLASHHGQLQHRRSYQPVPPYAMPYEVLPRGPSEGEDGARSEDAYMYFPYTVSGINGI